MVLFGPPGSGKTLHGSKGDSPGTGACRSGCCSRSATLLVQELLVAKRDLTLKGLLRRLANWDVLLIDVLGSGQQSRAAREVRCPLVAERYAMGSVMVTSNLAFSKWDQVFKDPMTTAAAIDRLVHHCTAIVELNVPSYRVETAKKAQKGQS